MITMLLLHIKVPKAYEHDNIIWGKKAKAASWACLNILFIFSILY